MTAGRSPPPQPGASARPLPRLAQQLDAYAAEVRNTRPETMAAIDRLIERLTKAQSGAGAPGIGESLPDFELPDEQGRLIALSDLIASGPLVVMLRRGHWCGYCRRATHAIVTIDKGARELGAGFVAISPERALYARRFKEATGASFPVLTDVDNGYALSLGLAIWVGEELRGHLIRNGVDLPLYQGSASWTLPIPATFVLDRRGIVIARHVDPDYRRRIEAEDVIAALRAEVDQPPS